MTSARYPRIAAAGCLHVDWAYRIPNIWVEFKPSTPDRSSDLYRGCGQPACFAIERAMDQLAEGLGIDRFEIRRRNLIREHEFPYPREGLLFADGLKVTLDSGQYAKALDMVAGKLDAASFAAEQQKARAAGRYLGMGLACYVEGTGLGPYEGGHIRIHPITGKVYVNTGLTSQGQGHDTVFAQIVADQLGVKPEDVIVVEGDTKAFDWGVATFASRAAVESGVPFTERRWSCDRRHCRPQPACSRSTSMMSSCSDRGLGQELEPFRALAAIATASNRRVRLQQGGAGGHPGCGASRHDGPPLAEGRRRASRHRLLQSAQSTWAYGVHAAIVEVDPELCLVKIGNTCAFTTAAT